jgi:hypothetical protein
MILSPDLDYWRELELILKLLSFLIILFVISVVQSLSCSRFARLI